MMSGARNARSIICWTRRLDTPSVVAICAKVSPALMRSKPLSAAEQSKGRFAPFSAPTQKIADYHCCGTNAIRLRLGHSIW